MSSNPSYSRYLAAMLCVALYALLCAWVVYREWKKRKAIATVKAALNSSNAGIEPWLIAYASQTGNAEQLALQTAQALQTANIPTQLMSFAQLSDHLLQQSKKLLFITSTYGEGDPPDNATGFARNVMSNNYSLGAVQYAVLALGDRQYKNFCGFGRSLDTWLQEQGAQPLFPRVDVSNSDAIALSNWYYKLSELTGSQLPNTTQQESYVPWLLAARRHMNPGSAGTPVYHIELAPTSTQPRPSWQAGDLVQIQLPSEPHRPREYSIASIPSDGRIHLLVRQERRPDGTLGLSSGWLTEHLALNTIVQLKIRAHSNFRIENNIRRPLILIGNGTGLAGLRAHLKARAETHTGQNWLIFGERNAAFDTYYRDELESWQQQGLLDLDLVFSRDQPQRLYVQDRLRSCADKLREWIQAGAAIYICGSLKGMAGDVDTALKEIIGADALIQLTQEGRYRRDVY